jgi:hypothetical protein
MIASWVIYNRFDEIEELATSLGLVLVWTPSHYGYVDIKDGCIVEPELGKMFKDEDGKLRTSYMYTRPDECSIQEFCSDMMEILPTLTTVACTSESCDNFYEACQLDKCTRYQNFVKARHMEKMEKAGISNENH